MDDNWLFYTGTHYSNDFYYVHGVTNDKNGYPQFLIRINNQWIWRSAKEFITYTEAEYKFPEKMKIDFKF